MIEVADEHPTPTEYCALRVAAGMSPRDVGMAAIGLPLSLHAVSVRDEGRLVGMGRVVGDGLHVQVVDIAVHPEYQGHGLSRVVLDSIMRFVATLPPTSSVSLFADVDWLYQKYGFAEPTNSTGMFLVREP